MKNTIFFANGLNRIDNSDYSISWEAILESIKTKPFSNKNLPNTMIYEKIVLDKHLPNGSLVKEEIIKKLKTIKTNEIYKLMYNSNICNFITTNYDYGFIENLRKNTDVEIKNLGNETTYSIRRVKQIKSKSKPYTQFLWQIHGELDYIRTIMLGFNHYCGYIGKIDDYIKGKYEAKKEKSMKDKIKSNVFSNVSWIDLFFNTNIHIIGYSLDYAETDIWWILNQRARLKYDKEVGKLISNKIYFYCANIDSAKKELLESFDIIVCIIKKTKGKHLQINDYKKIIKNIH